jgi:hypothetical protein
MHSNHQNAFVRVCKAITDHKQHLLLAAVTLKLTVLGINKSAGEARTYRLQNAPHRKHMLSTKLSTWTINSSKLAQQQQPAAACMCCVANPEATHIQTQLAR